MTEKKRNKSARDKLPAKKPVASRTMKPKSSPANKPYRNTLRSVDGANKSSSARNKTALTGQFSPYASKADIEFWDVALPKAMKKKSTSRRRTK